MVSRSVSQSVSQLISLLVGSICESFRESNRSASPSGGQSVSLLADLQHNYRLLHFLARSESRDRRSRQIIRSNVEGKACNLLVLLVM